MTDRTEAEQAALQDLEGALVRGHSLAAEGRSGGARRKELRERLDALAGRLSDHADAGAWLQAREQALGQVRRDLGREIEELRGQQERLLTGWSRLFPPASVRALQGRRVRRILDLLEILGRLAELREIRRELSSGSAEAHEG